MRCTWGTSSVLHAISYSCRYLDLESRSFLNVQSVNCFLLCQLCQPQRTELLCVVFLWLVELLSDTVLSLNSHHFFGIYAIFVWDIYAILGESIRPFT